MRPSSQPAVQQTQRGRPRRRHRGQGIVEFVLVLPILMLILLLAIDLGRLYFGWVALQNASRIGANFAADNPESWVSPGDPNQALYQQLIKNDATTIDCTLPSPIPTPTFPDAAPYAVGSRAVVSLKCGFTLLTPFLGNLLGNPLQLGATTVYPIRGGIVGLPTAAPTASPTPSPSPSPSLGQNQCTVPTFINAITANNALTAWTTAGFNKNKLTVTIGSPNYTIGSENPPNSDGTVQNCNNFTLTVGP